eukprot:gene16540-biopygen17267
MGGGGTKEVQCRGRCQQQTRTKHTARLHMPYPCISISLVWFGAGRHPAPTWRAGLGGGRRRRRPPSPTAPHALAAEKERAPHYPSITNLPSLPPTPHAQQKSWSGKLSSAGFMSEVTGQWRGRGAGMARAWRGL